MEGGEASRVALRGWERLAREVAGPHESWEDTGEGSCMVGAPTAVSITDPQSGAERAGQELGAPHVFLN